MIYFIINGNTIMSNTDSSMTELLKYAYLSMSGYLNKDIPD